MSADKWDEQLLGFGDPDEDWLQLKGGGDKAEEYYGSMHEENPKGDSQGPVKKGKIQKEEEATDIRIIKLIAVGFWTLFNQSDVSKTRKTFSDKFVAWQQEITGHNHVFPSEDNLREEFYLFHNIDETTNNISFENVKSIELNEQEFKERLNNFVIAKQRKEIFVTKKQNTKFFPIVKICVDLMNFLNKETTGCEIQAKYYEGRKFKDFQVVVTNPAKFNTWIIDANNTRMEFQKVRIRDILVFCNIVVTNRWEAVEKCNLIMIYRVDPNQKDKEYLYIYPKKTSEDQAVSFAQNDTLVIYYNEKVLTWIEPNKKTKEKLIITDKKPGKDKWPSKEDILCCITCGLYDKPLYLCAGCKKSIYCGIECQKKDWHTGPGGHAKECK